MVLRMKNVNVLGVNQKIRKTSVEGGLPKKGCLDSVANLRRGLGKKQG